MSLLNNKPSAWSIIALMRTRFGRQYLWLPVLSDAVQREQWDEEKVLSRIRQLIHDVPIDRIRSVDSKLTSAAERRFGSIRKAVEVAQSLGAAREARKAQ